MDLYLIRHADAVPLGEQGIEEDAERPLTEKGEAQVKTVAAGLQRRGAILNVVVTSPLRRARQTAEGILRQWAVSAPQLVVAEELAPGGQPRKLARLLRSLGAANIAVVGHQPDLNQWAAWLIGSKKAQIEIAKAGVAHITSGDGPRKGAGMLQWLVTPEWFDNFSGAGAGKL